MIISSERLAFSWIQKHISAFGGDPTKVTMYGAIIPTFLYSLLTFAAESRWGESAGAISAALHLVANGGNNEGLFRGAFMESGSPIPVSDITDGQADYDAIVQETGCQGSADTLECLRQVPFDTLMAAVNDSPGIFARQVSRSEHCPRNVIELFLEVAQTCLAAESRRYFHYRRSSTAGSRRPGCRCSVCHRGTSLLVGTPERDG